MAMLPKSLEALVQLGANIEITAEARYLPDTIEKILHIAKRHGSHVTIEAGTYLPDTLQSFVRIAQGNITIKV